LTKAFGTFKLNYFLGPQPVRFYKGFYSSPNREFKKKIEDANFFQHLFALSRLPQRFPRRVNLNPDKDTKQNRKKFVNGRLNRNGIP
jgi:hypothetical protein